MFNEKQNQIFIGSMLGDGCIVKNKSHGTCRFQLIQSKLDNSGINKKSYLEYFDKEFNDFSTKITSMSVKTNGIVKKLSGDKSFDRYVFYTHHLKFWEKLEQKWYVPRTDHKWFKRRKIIPKDIKLTPLILCIWMMEDGSNYAKDGNITLETQGFTIEEIDFLIKRLEEDLGIIGNKKKTKKNQYRIFIGVKSFHKFIEIIKPHIEWDCFKYKIDDSYNKVPHVGENHSLSKLTEEKVKEMIELRRHGMLLKNIAKLFNISEANVSLATSGNRWKYLNDHVEVKNKPRITKETKQRVLAMFENGSSQNFIAKELNINQASVSRILKSMIQLNN